MKKPKLWGVECYGSSGETLNFLVLTRTTNNYLWKIYQFSVAEVALCPTETKTNCIRRIRRMAICWLHCLSQGHSIKKWQGISWTYISPLGGCTEFEPGGIVSGILFSATRSSLNFSLGSRTQRVLFPRDQTPHPTREALLNLNLDAGTLGICFPLPDPSPKQGGSAEIGGVCFLLLDPMQGGSTEFEPGFTDMGSLCPAVHTCLTRPHGHTGQ